MLTLIYGGTFDPIHVGHLALACQTARLLATDVHLLPSADPPHREPPGARAEDRAAMVALAIAEQPALHLDRRELDRPGPSYMVDTLISYRDQWGADQPLALLLGADAFAGLPGWSRWRHLFDLAHLVIAPRPAWPLDRLPDVLRDACAGRWLATVEGLQTRPAGGLFRLPLTVEYLESATEVRRRIAEGGDWRALVPIPVADYIDRHRLYR